MKLDFIKMNGAGNDFIIFDARNKRAAASGQWSGEFSPAQIRALSARDNEATKGCDQLIIMDIPNAASTPAPADVAMIIYNSDGNEVSSCGNATRCIAWLEMQKTGKDEVTVESGQRILSCYKAGDKKIKVNMGSPIFDSKYIPITKETDRKNIPISYGAFKGGVAVGMGNPHVIFFVDDANTSDLEKYGKVIEQENLWIFPARVNVSAAQIIDKSHIKLRVWERGAGITLACGTGACATLVAAVEKGMAERKADVEMPGGTLTIEWDTNNHVWMTGEIEKEFEGTVEI